MAASGNCSKACNDFGVVLGALTVQTLPEMARTSVGNEAVGASRGVLAWGAAHYYRKSQIKNRKNAAVIANATKELESDSDVEHVAHETRPIADSIAISQTDMSRNHTYGTAESKAALSSSNCCEYIKYFISAAFAGAGGVCGEYLHQVFTFFNAISGTSTPSTTVLSSGLGIISGEVAYQTMDRICCPR